MAWMYMLRCADGTYYVGSTVDMTLRLAEHQQGIASRYTSGRRPVSLVYACEFASVRDAYERENQVKGWSRAKKEALMRGDWATLPKLSERRKVAEGGGGTASLPSRASGNDASFLEALERNEARKGPCSLSQRKEPQCIHQPLTKLEIWPARAT